MMRLLVLFVLCSLLCAAAPARSNWVRIAMAENSSVDDAVKTMKDVAGKADAEASDGQSSTATDTTVKPNADPIGTIKKVYTDQDDKSADAPGDAAKGAGAEKGAKDALKNTTDAAKKQVADTAKKNLKSAAKAGAKKLSPVAGGIIVVVGLFIAFAGVGLLRKLAHRISDAINDAE